MVTLEDAAKIVTLGQARTHVAARLKKLQDGKASAGSIRLMVNVGGYDEDITVIVPGPKLMAIAIAQLQLQIDATDRQLRALGAVLP